MEYSIAKIEEAVKEVLGEMPKIKGYDGKDVKKYLPKSWPFQRWHLEVIESPRDSNERIGSFPEKIEKMMKRKK